MIKITSLDHNGRGISKLNNKIVFVENALPEEIVNIKIIKEKKNYIEAEVLNYINKSERRINSPCPYFEKCGGCDLLHMNYDDQLKFKQNKINNIINKYMNEDIKINEIVSSSSNFNYRNKVTFQVNKKLGFYKKRSYEIINIDECLISSKLINNSIKYLNKLNLNEISKIVCRVGNNELMIIIETTNKNLNIDAIKDIASSIYLKIDNKYNLVWGNKYIYETIGNFKYLVSPNSFFQTNLDICLKLYNKINDYVGNNKNVLDLYCGTGSIGIFVSKNNQVLGIEVNESSVKDALKNKEINDTYNTKFICGDSGKELNCLKFKPDTIIVDPPRAGLDELAIKNIIKFKPDTLIYVSCDPMTLVRDLNLLKKKFKIEEITPFDMFCNTKHVECLCLLKYKK